MLLDPAAQRAAEDDFRAEHPRSTLTYLANTIAAGDKQFPYSTICAIDFPSSPPQGPFTTPDGTDVAPLKDDEIALNTWAAEDLGAKLGDEIRVDYFEPETLHGQVRQSTARFRLAAIIAMTGAGLDRNLTPEVRGITDQKSIADWDPPFPFDATRVRKQDEKYWDDYRTTPKAFVSLAAGQRLWSSRFGNATSLQFDPPAQGTPERFAAQLATKLDPTDNGPAAAAGQTARPGSRNRHDAIQPAVPRVQLFHRGGGGDAGVAAVPLGDRTAGPRNRHPRSRGLLAPASGDPLGGRRVVRRRGRRAAGRGSRSGIRIAHAVWPAHLVGGRHYDPFLAVALDAAEPDCGIRRRRGRVAGHDALVAAAIGTLAGAPALGRASGRE